MVSEPFGEVVEALSGGFSFRVLCVPADFEPGQRDFFSGERSSRSVESREDADDGVVVGVSGPGLLVVGLEFEEGDIGEFHIA